MTLLMITLRIILMKVGDDDHDGIYIMVECVCVCHEKVNKSSLPFRAERRRRKARRRTCTRPEVYKSRRSILGPASRRPAQGLVMIMIMMMMVMMTVHDDDVES